MTADAREVTPGRRVGRGSGSPLSSQVVARLPLDATGGRSGARLERVRLADGRELVAKHVRADEDFVMTATADRGRLGLLWRSGLLHRVPPVIDHAIVDVESDGDGWVVYMRDVTAALLPDDRVLTRAENRRVLEAVVALHEELRGTPADGLCALEDRLGALAPGQPWLAASPLGPLVDRGWDAFSVLAPRDVGEVVAAIHSDPGVLAGALASCDATFIHGDLRLANLGLLPDRVVLLDWGSLASVAPPAVEILWYLILSASRIAASREEVLADYAAIAGDTYDPHAVDLATIAALVLLGWNKGIDAVEHPDPSIRARELADLQWWVRRVQEALDRWSPA